MSNRPESNLEHLLNAVHHVNSSILYAFSALRHNGFRMRGLASFFYRFVRHGLVTPADMFFSRFDPYFPIVDWQKLANENGTVINLQPGEEKDLVCTLQDDLFIACLVKWLAPKTVLEIGTYLGWTTRTLFLNSGEETEIFTVDLPKEHALGKETSDADLAQRSIECYENRPYLPKSSRVHLILSDSTKLDWCEAVGGRRVDLVLIDGSHSLFHASQDTQRALEVLSDQGAIAWHDAWYRNYGYFLSKYRVHDAIREVLSESYKSHVYRMLGTGYALYCPQFSEMISERHLIKR